MFDLFGNYYEEEYKPAKTLEEEYQEYINSSAWKRLRDAKIKQAGGRCERCGLSKWSVRLEVHHKDYKHFKHERLEDLEVLCQDCHAYADVKRVEIKEDKRSSSALVRGFENFMDHNQQEDGWRGRPDGYLETKWEEFLYFIHRSNGKQYNAKFWRSPNWYE